MRIVLASLLLSLGLSSTALAQSDEAKSSCDRAVSWIVRQQKEDGSYGGNVESTARAIYALAVSPRKYRDDDGPFVRKAVDYVLANWEKASPSALLASESALKSMNSKKYEGALAALAKKIDESNARSGANPVAGTEGKPEDLVKAQSPNGSWSDSLDDTTSRVITLSKKPATSAPKMDEVWAKGVKYLLSQRVNGLWGFPGKPDPGVTGLAVSALLAAPNRDAETEKAIDEGLKYLASLAKPDGSIYDKGYANYTTCCAVMAFTDSGKAEYKPLVEKAQAYIVSLQADEKRGYRPDDKFYGGIGYGGAQRSDLSNLQFALESLEASGLPKNHPVYQKAVTFLNRTQNHSESNDYTTEVDGQKYVPGNDGGAAYFPGNSMAGYETLPDGTKVARSYGSMTYALLRGYLFAGLEKDDTRVKAAVSWIQKNYTVQENPGFDKKDMLTAGMQGYYYYLLTMAKALHALEIDSVTTPDGAKHNWREELKAKFASMQKPDGSWTNELSGRWYEGNPSLATAYALSALKYTK